MPTMTASTITFTPEATILPSTFSARKAVLLKSAKGMRMKPASVVSLNSIKVTKSCTARIKKAISTRTHETISTAICTKFAKKLVKPIIWLAASSSGWPASSPTWARWPG